MYCLSRRGNKEYVVSLSLSMQIPNVVNDLDCNAAIYFV